jgi:hypothetical protein
VIDSHLAHPASRAQRGARSSQHRISSALLILLLAPLCGLVGLASGRAAAEEISKAHMQSLDEQVQEIKSDVLEIAAELDQLEERLLYPSNTQIAVFVAIAEGEDFRLDSVQLELDGELVAHHIYTFKELEALQKGGVQRLFTGNVATGGHRLDVTLAGKRAGGDDFSARQSFDVQKSVEPKLVELTLADGGSDDSIRLGGL